MNKVDYTPNSHKYKNEQKAATEQPKVQKVVKGTAARKKNGVRNFKNIMAPGDVNNIKDYIIMDILIPSAKKVLSEAGRVFIDMLVWGDSGRTRNGSAPYDKVSYNDYGRYSSNNQQSSATRTRSVFGCDDVIVNSRWDAEEVIRTLNDILETYQVVSIATFYDVCGIRDDNYMNNKYGWTSVRNAEVVPTRDGRFAIRMPKAMPLNN